MVKQNVREETQKIAERLRELIGSRSVRGFARVLDLPHTTVVQYVRGQVDIPGSALAHVCTQTSTSGHWLLTGEGPRDAKGLQPPNSGDVDDTDDYEDDTDETIQEIVSFLKMAAQRGDQQTIGYIKGYLVATEGIKREEENAKERETKTKADKKRA